MGVVYKENDLSSYYFYGHDDTRVFLVNSLVSQKNVFFLCSRPVFNVILARLGASTRFFSQAQQRTRIHSLLVTIRQNAMFSLNSLMRMKRNFLLLTLLWGALSAWAHDAEVDGIFYNLNNAKKTATVTYKGESLDAYDSEYAGDVVIPKAVTYNGITYSVTSLGGWCFKNCSSLTSITIGNSVTSLGTFCFWKCRSLTSITIPNSVTSLDDNCFDSCSSLTSIYMLPTTPPRAVQLIFFNTPLKTVYVVNENAKKAYQAQWPWNEYKIVVKRTGIK